MASSDRGRKRPRKQQALSARRGPSPWLIVAVVVVVVFAGAVGVAVWRSGSGNRAADAAAPVGSTATGITVGQAAAPATIDLYVDFQCPVCRAYEAQTGATIDQLVASGQAKVVYHPLAFLDRMSSTKYSTRSSQAAACAADAGVFPKFAAALWAAQPPEGGAGLPDEQLISIGTQAGAGDAFTTCVTSGRYADWTKAVTADAVGAGIQATPTVKVNGTEIERSTQALVAAVQAAAR